MSLSKTEIKVNLDLPFFAIQEEAGVITFQDFWNHKFWVVIFTF